MPNLITGNNGANDFAWLAFQFACLDEDWCGVLLHGDLVSPQLRVNALFLFC